MPIHACSDKRRDKSRLYIIFAEIFLLRKAFGILLIVSVCAPFFGTVAWLNYQKKVIRKEIKQNIIAGIDRSELVLLKFSESESHTKLNWEHSKEFCYQDQMYDVVETELHGDSIYYWCWSDYDETTLNQQLFTTLAFFLDQNQERSEKTERIVCFSKRLYFQQARHVVEHWVITTVTSGGSLVEDENSGFRAHLYEPPEIIS